MGIYDEKSLKLRNLRMYDIMKCLQDNKKKTRTEHIKATKTDLKNSMVR